MRRGEARGWEAAESHADSRVFTKSPALLPLCSGAGREAQSGRRPVPRGGRDRERRPPNPCTVSWAGIALEEMQAGTRAREGHVLSHSVSQGGLSRGELEEEAGDRLHG